MSSRACLRRNGPRFGLSSATSSVSGYAATIRVDKVEGDSDDGARLLGSRDGRRPATVGVFLAAARPGMVGWGSMLGEARWGDLASVSDTSVSLGVARRCAVCSAPSSTDAPSSMETHALAWSVAAE